jgi:ABC-type multidrug transport system fused ATPase/permease subunit
MYSLNYNAPRSKNLLIAFYLGIAITFMSIIHSVQEKSLLERIAVGNFTDEEAASSDTIGSVIGISEMALNIVIIVLFILWFRRAYYNLHQINRTTLSYEEGWAAGAWFVPFLNLFRPFQIMSEIWKGTFRLTNNEEEEIPASSLLGIWWAIWIIKGILGNITLRMTLDADTIDEMISVDNIAILSGVAEIVASVLIILIIRKLQPAEEKLFDTFNQKDISDHLIIS